MRCLKCGQWSLRLVCKDCSRILAEYEAGTRLAGDLKVYYFYKYSDIRPLILTKHTLCGHFVFRHLAALSFKKFADKFDFGQSVAAVPIDDNIRSGWSHTAILARSLKNDNISPIYGRLHSNNSVKYAGKSLKYRQQHARGFRLSAPIDRPVILIDDIITTGQTIKEAAKTLKKSGTEVLFGLVLADAREDE